MGCQKIISGQAVVYGSEYNEGDVGEKFMGINSSTSFILVILGTIIMSINIIRYSRTYKNFKLISKEKRKFIDMECKIHLILMFFFLLGYLLVAAGIIFEHIVIGLTFVGVIFFFGVIFVFIGITEDILNIPGKLSESEFDIIKTHPKIGNDIIKNISGLDEISEWILYNHERVDGKGHYKINKEKIPLEARIIAVADTFSTLVTNRPYREGMKYEKTVEIMKECSGKQLDSAILDTFLNIPIEELDKCMPNNL